MSSSQHQAAGSPRCLCFWIPCPDAKHKTIPLFWLVLHKSSDRYALVNPFARRFFFIYIYSLPTHPSSYPFASFQTDFIFPPDEHTRKCRHRLIIPRLIIPLSHQDYLNYTSSSWLLIQTLSARLINRNTNWLGAYSNNVTNSTPIYLENNSECVFIFGRRILDAREQEKFSFRKICWRD